ncbi:MAG TPA: hypothetical protein VIV60_15415, partial [Polyangiaceae bacterium]
MSATKRSTRPPSAVKRNPSKLLVPKELAWLSFNERVLEEANDSSNPLLERIKFLGIFSNN